MQYLCEKNIQLFIIFRCKVVFMKYDLAFLPDYLRSFVGCLCQKQGCKLLVKTLPLVSGVLCG